MSHAPHITYAIQDLDSSGAMRAPYLILKGFAGEGWQTDIVTTASTYNTEMDCVWGTVPVRRIEGTSRKEKLRRLATLLYNRERSNVVITFVWDWHCFALALAQMIGRKPYVVALDTYIHQSPAEHSTALARLRRELRYGFILRRASMIMAEAPASFEYAKRAFPKNDVRLVPFSLWRADLERVESDWTREGFAPERAPVILYAGRLVARKHIPDLIEAFRRLVPEFPGWKLELRAVGGEKAEIARVRELLRGNDLASRAAIMPALSSADLYKRYRETSIVALPSEAEGLPTGITEAMYFGGAIVAGRSGFVAYQLENGKCGLLHKPGDVETLTAHLRTLMSLEETRKELRERARARMLRKFTWENYFPALQEKFRALADSD